MLTISFYAFMDLFKVLFSAQSLAVFRDIFIPVDENSFYDENQQIRI